MAPGMLLIRTDADSRLSTNHCSGKQVKSNGLIDTQSNIALIPIS